MNPTHHPAVHHTAAQLAHYCADHFPHHGVSLMTALIAGTVSLLAGFGLGWYVKGRGLTGVKTDATNAVKTVQTDVSKIETAVNPAPTVATVAG